MGSSSPRPIAVGASLADVRGHAVVAFVVEPGTMLGTVVGER